MDYIYIHVVRKPNAMRLVTLLLLREKGKMSLITDVTKCEIRQMPGTQYQRDVSERNFIAAALVNVPEECGNNSAFPETIIDGDYKNARIPERCCDLL